MCANSSRLLPTFGFHLGEGNLWADLELIADVDLFFFGRRELPVLSAPGHAIRTSRYAYADWQVC